MKTDVINGYEWLIFEENEEEAAREAAKKDSFVRIATTCADCGGYIERSPSQRGSVRHGEGACQE